MGRVFRSGFDPSGDGPSGGAGRVNVPACASHRAFAARDTAVDIGLRCAMAGRPTTLPLCDP